MQRMPKSASAPPQRKPIKLALQGGGAHGAFTWGVLEILADGRLEIRRSPAPAPAR
jgi:predicted acylesterase/phospholipase RssA